MYLPRPSRLGALWVLLLTAACGQQSPTAGSREQALATLRAADSTLQVAVAARDVAATLALYADDAVLMPLAKPVATGRDAIRREWEHTFGIPGFANTAQLTGLDVSDDGTMGVTRGSYEATMKAPDGQSIVERGKWVSVRRRVADGPWRLTIDIYNTDTLPPEHQASTAEEHKH
jgi:ketosteroid isomerase-like protein